MHHILHACGRTYPDVHWDKKEEGYDQDEVEWFPEQQKRHERTGSEGVAAEEDIECVRHVMLYIQIEMIHA